MKPKKLVSFLMATTMTITLLSTFTITVSAETGTQYGNTGLYYTKYDDHCEITDCDTSVTSAAIPETIENLPVTAIGNKAFSYCGNLEFVTIPKSVTSVGLYAFEDCKKITEITLPESVETVRNYAFKGCTDLKDITILNDNMTNLSYMAFYDSGYYNDEKNWENGVLYIGTYAITAKSSDAGEIAIKDGTKVILEYAFQENVSITSVTFPSSLTKVGEMAFYNCSALKSIKFPTVASMTAELHAFAYCTGLKSIKFPTDGSLTIERRAFRDCTGLEILKIPNNVTLNGENIFWNCSSLKHVEFNGNVIPKNTFQNSINLTSLVIGDKVESIDEYAFYNCAVKELTLPKSIKSIGYSAFDKNSIKKINYAGNREEWNNVVIKTGNNFGSTEKKYNCIPKSFTFTGHSDIDDCTVILALYKNSGAELADYLTFVYHGEEINFLLPTDDYITAKVMVWKDLETIEPIEPVTEVKNVNMEQGN